MKRFRLLIGLIFLAINSYSQIKITTNVVNLRSSPVIKENKICKIPKGVLVKIDKDSDFNRNWTKINYNGKIGYVSSTFLKSISSSSKNYNNNSHQKSTKYYKNFKGEKVQSPTYYKSAPAGATAKCYDGTYSFSHSHRGTCSHHGGVKQWL